MRINYAEHTTYESIERIAFDVIICASGYETRSSFFYSKFGQIATPILKKYCFSFSDRRVLAKTANDTFFSENKFEFIEYENFDLNKLIEIFETIFSPIEKRNIKVIIDYSCMTKLIYAGIIKFFSLYESNLESVEIFFVYTQALYSEPGTIKSNLHNQPIPLFPRIEFTDKKIALIANIGYEEGKALGLMEYLQIDKSDIYIFHTSKESDKVFFEKIRANNRYMLNKIPINNQFQFDLQNLTQIFSLLESISTYLISKDYRVIIAPLGPKVFALISILLTLKYKDLTILRVSDGIMGDPIDRKPNISKDLIILKVAFSKNIDSELHEPSV